MIEEHRNEDGQITFSINDGDAFFAHEASINFNPLQFSFDFKSITPRTDVRSKTSAVFALKHTLVMMDVFHAKDFLRVLSEALKKYETVFGKIKKPDALVKAESIKSGDKKQPSNAPVYFG